MTHSNHLIREKSHYLLQHAHNPVNWYPWGDEAFAQARIQDKPLFLSIGYATCHWCHVMERDSFEDAEAAARLNETFVCIKVDREERPDIDALYMAVCQMLTGSGGWPLSIFITVDKIPFWAATYIPKHGRLGQGGIMEICSQVQNLWKYKRESILNSAENVAEHLKQAFAFSEAEPVTEDTAVRAFREMEQSFDPEYGGFETAPKFPTPHRLLFLLRHYQRTGNTHALEMVEKTLKTMRMGGIWDHAGFGFHRYSTDQHWLLPHFEKMLYDQALLALAYLETWNITREPAWKQTAEEIFSYVLRDMTADPEGGFYSAEDADSEGVEGKFYVWSLDEFLSVPAWNHPKESDVWEKIFNLSAEGNFREEAGGHKSGNNILHIKEFFWEKSEETALRWYTIRRQLYEYRKNRIPPLKDDKILTDWNGLMIAALAYGGRILDKSLYIQAAQKALVFIEKKMTDKDGRLLHRFRDGESGIKAYADNYAFLIWGVLELSRATGDPAYPEKALRLQQQMYDDFWDREKSGFFLTSADTDLPVRPKELYDGATPSANSVSVHNLLQLSSITGDIRWKEDADRLIRAFSGSVSARPSAFCHFLSGAVQGESGEHQLSEPGFSGLKD
ncbi:MAG: thioredoxin domain-containing protein [Desulfococcaceae bacterium]